MLTDNSTHQYFLCLSGPEASRHQLSLIIKRLMLSRHGQHSDLLHIATTQAAVIVLTGPHAATFAASMMHADLAG